jgi:cysteine desulfurase
MTYFDWNATAPLLKGARKAWQEASETAWVNPSTPYRAGVRARLVLDECRQQMSELLGVHPERVIFTSGATEANNGMIREAARRRQAGEPIWISAVEHPSVRDAAVEYWGADCVHTVPVDEGGRVHLDWMVDRLKGQRPALVSVMAVNNETGVIQPWQEVLQLCQSAGIPFHCDAVQMMGKLGLRGEPLGNCAGLSMSAHKFGGPKGVGCLVLGPEWRGLHVQSGGGQEFDSRAGTENIAGAVAMSVALMHRMENPPDEAKLSARDQFEDKLNETFEGQLVIHGSSHPRVWNTSSVRLPQHRASRWILRLDKKGFQVSSGSACSTGKEGPSPVLAAMGCDAEVAARTLRISSGWETTPEDWDSLLEAIKEIQTDLDEPEAPQGPGKVIEI